MAKKKTQTYPYGARNDTTAKMNWVMAQGGTINSPSGSMAATPQMRQPISSMYSPSPKPSSMPLRGPDPITWSPTTYGPSYKPASSINQNGTSSGIKIGYNAVFDPVAAEEYRRSQEQKYTPQGQNNYVNMLNAAAQERERAQREYAERVNAAAERARNPINQRLTQPYGSEYLRKQQMEETGKIAQEKARYEYELMYGPQREKLRQENLIYAAMHGVNVPDVIANSENIGDIFTYARRKILENEREETKAREYARASRGYSGGASASGDINRALAASLEKINAYYASLGTFGSQEHQNAIAEAKRQAGLASSGLASSGQPYKNPYLYFG
jgi:hypothetical protein